jgi:hypothetical protein
LDISGPNSITDWDLPPAITGALVTVDFSMAQDFVLMKIAPPLIVSGHLTTRLLTNDRLMNMKTGLERARALAQ